MLLLQLLFVMLLAATDSEAFVVPSKLTVCIENSNTNQANLNKKSFSTALFASKKKKKVGKQKPKTKSGTGGFGGGSKNTKVNQNQGSATNGVGPVRADKDSLELQWDSFAAITDLEIRPIGDPEDDDYVHFEVADVFVRSGGSSENKSTGWFRIGKACASKGATIEASLTLQKGLIFWTAVHLRRELMALGKASAATLELGYSVPAIVYMGSETDGPEDEDEASDYMKVFATKEAPEVLRKIESQKWIGFRPDWNPPGFTYKRRESAAMKDKNQNKSSNRLFDALENESDGS